MRQGDVVISRRLFVVWSVSSLIVGPAAAQTQNSTRIGYLSPMSLNDDDRVFPAFREGLRALGYVEGPQLVIDRRLATSVEELPRLARDLVANRVDIIVAATTPAAMAAKDATRSIPIVFIAVSDPVGSGLVVDLARPGTNATGLTDQALDLVAKRLDLLRQMVPKLRRVAVLGAPGDPVWQPTWNELEVAARRLNLEVIPVLSDSPDDWPTLVANVRSRVQAMYVAPQAVFVAHNRDVIQLAAREKLPAMYEAWGYVQNGGLVSYGADYLSIFRGAARYVDKIIRGTPAGDLPVEHTRDFRTSVNLRTAKTLGLNVPQAVLLTADEVIR